MIPLDSPIYLELETLDGLGYLDTYFLEIRPFSRVEAARLTLEAERNSTLEKSGREIAEADENLKAERERLDNEEKTRQASEKIADIEAQAQRIEVESQTELFQKDVISRITFMRSDYSLKTLEEKLDLARIQPGDVVNIGVTGDFTDETGAILPASYLTFQSTNPAVFTKGTAISPDDPSSSGGAVTSYAISPGLPAGLHRRPHRTRKQQPAQTHKKSGS